MRCADAAGAPERDRIHQLGCAEVYLRRRHRHPATIYAVSLAAGILLAGLLYAANRLQIVRLDWPGAATMGVAPSTAGPPTAVVTSVDGLSLYFTTPDVTAALENASGGIPDAIIASFDAARHTIDVAVYDFDLVAVADALVRASARGVAVRVVIDRDAASEAAIVTLKRANVPVVDDGREALMHDKFAVIDGAAVWTGSMNFTYNDAYRNDNNQLLINSSALAQNYTTEFEEMFIFTKFGPGSPADTPNSALSLDGVRVENYFSPDDGVARRVLALLKSAQSSVYFLAFSFTRQDFAEALLERSAHGVTVKGVFETRQITAGADQAWVLLTAGGLASNVRQDGNPYNLHSKVFIVDERTVVTGSYNFSRNAEERNDENVLIITDPDLARAYFIEWQRVWAQAGE